MKRFNIIGLLSLMLIIALIFISAPTVKAAMVGTATLESGSSAWELIGQTEQDGQDVEHFGYLTHISGLLDELLFFDPDDRTEATARFTFFGSSTITARHEHGDIIVTAAPGEMRIYFKETLLPSDFSDKGSFRNGTLIALFSVSYHSVLNVEHDDEDIGSTAATAELTQSEANQFGLNGKNLKLGQKNLHGRLSISGEGNKTSDSPLQSRFHYGANFTVGKGKKTR